LHLFIKFIKFLSYFLFSVFHWVLINQNEINNNEYIFLTFYDNILFVHFSLTFTIFQAKIESKWSLKTGHAQLNFYFSPSQPNKLSFIKNSIWGFWNIYQANYFLEKLNNYSLTPTDSFFPIFTLTLLEIFYFTWSFKIFWTCIIARHYIKPTKEQTDLINL
jgi:hypothetical protein